MYLTAKLLLNSYKQQKLLKNQKWSSFDSSMQRIMIMYQKTRLLADVMTHDIIIPVGRNLAEFRYNNYWNCYASKLIDLSVRCNEVSRKSADSAAYISSPQTPSLSLKFLCVLRIRLHRCGALISRQTKHCSLEEVVISQKKYGESALDHRTPYKCTLML